MKYKFSIKLPKVNGRFHEFLEDLDNERGAGHDRFLQEAHNVDYFRTGYGHDRHYLDAGHVRREPLIQGQSQGQFPDRATPIFRRGPRMRELWIETP